MRLRSSAPRHSSSVLSAMRAPPPPPPTLLTRISIPPKAAAASTSRAAWSGCPTSARQDTTATPSARKAASAAASGAAERADSTRWQPSAAKAWAVARPIPRLEPVIRVTLSFSFRSIARLHSVCPGRASIQGGFPQPPSCDARHERGGQKPLPGGYHWSIAMKRLLSAIQPDVHDRYKSRDANRGLLQSRLDIVVQSVLYFLWKLPGESA